MLLDCHGDLLDVMGARVGAAVRLSEGRIYSTFLLRENSLCYVGV